MGAAAFAEVGARRVAIAGLASISLDEYAVQLRLQLTAGSGCALGVQLVHRAEVHVLMHDLADASQGRFDELMAHAKCASASRSTPS